MNLSISLKISEIELLKLNLLSFSSGANHQKHFVRAVE